jgi:hypothetical protein
LTVQFDTTFMGPSITTLRLQQQFQLLPPGLASSGGPQPLEYVVQPPRFATPVTQGGGHPLITSFTGAGLWWVVVNTRTVDVTAVQPLFLKFRLKQLIRSSPETNVRVLARTDGTSPLHWITATPPACSSFADNDLVCFLTAPQGSLPENDNPTFYLTSNFDPKSPQEGALLANNLGKKLGGGQDDNRYKPPYRDFFTPGPPGTAPWVVLPRGWEAALAASGKHVALVLPVAAGGQNLSPAATRALPKLLRDIHATLSALGDIAAPAGLAVHRPQLGIAAHSNGGRALFAAVFASPKAFREIWLFETNGTQKNVPTVARASGAKVLFAGFNPETVSKPKETADEMPSLRGRTRRLPDVVWPNPALTDDSSPWALAASSSKLTHALEGGGMANPASTWNPIVRHLAGGVKWNERREVLHQQIVQGNDADGADYLTKALTSSVFH